MVSLSPRFPQQAALDVLKSIYDELRSMETSQDTHNMESGTAMSIPGATVYDLGEGLLDGRTLQLCNDQLVDLLEPVDRKTLARYLFRSILRTEDVNGLRRIESETESYGGVAEIQPLASADAHLSAGPGKGTLGRVKT